MKEALEKFVYETTHLSSIEDDGSHWAKISAECLDQGRKALNQPVFILNAADPMARHLVRMWAMLRIGNHDEAFTCWTRLQKMAPSEPVLEDDELATDAIACAWSMIDWYNKNVLIPSVR